MNVNLIGIPLFYGCDRKGPETAPDLLRNNAIKHIISKHGYTVYDLGNLYVKKETDENKFKSNSNMKYLDSIVDVNTNLAHMVYSSLNSNSFPFMLGGDHSLGLGSISGVSKHDDKFAVIWMDAHGDINTHETSKSGNTHGMPLGACMGFGHEKLTNLYFKGQKVKPQNVFILGARDLDEGEINLIKQNNLNAYSPEYMKSKGLKEIVSSIISTLRQNNIDKVHLSFDMDFIDSKFVPGTGTPVDSGFNIEETKTILKEILESKLVKSIDFVEFNPNLDKENKTLNLAIDLIDFMFENLKY
ncbi:arginase [Tepidibacter mesophilus]|uniref:arginase n=1 Tax=Tepidibacter mesophilus TaxID=655607 RepID=UPI000C072B54|nr:arginase [Tepidibacter mesophilus]